MATPTTAHGQLAALKDKHRRMWAAGEYARSASYIGEVGPDLVRRLGVGAGARVLDVATGTGLAAIPAALAGAEVTGLDLTPDLLEQAGRRASAAGVAVRWVEGDAEAMPFEDESFDLVLSTFGIQFAPVHERAASELARVCAPGGRLGLCNWTPEGFIGQFLKVVAGHLPPPPAGISPPPRWGDRGHVQTLLGDAFELEFDVATADFVDDTPTAFVDSFAGWYGPLLTARKATGRDGWPALRADLIELTEAGDRGRYRARVPSDYLVVTGRRTHPPRPR